MYTQCVIRIIHSTIWNHLKSCSVNNLNFHFVELTLCYSNFFLILDTVKPGGKGGGVDTGETSNQFFDPKNQEAILSLCTQVRILFHGFESDGS